MELKQFIDMKIQELNLKYPESELLDYVKERARKNAKNGYFACDDSEVEKWLKEYNGKSTKIEETNKEEPKKEENTFVYKPIEKKRPKKVKDEGKCSWGQMDSLF